MPATNEKTLPLTLLLLGLPILAWILLKLLAVFRGPTPPRPPKPYFEGRPPLVFAHRGDSANFPENTLPAFRAAVEVGVDALETDVWLTRDRIPVAFHDSTLDRTTDGTGPIGDLRLDELQGLDAGHGFSRDRGSTYPHRGKGIRVPSLEELFREFPEARINIDIKDPSPDGAERVMEVVRRFGREERTLLVSLHPATQDRLARDWAAFPRAEDHRSTAALVILNWLGLGDVWRPSADALQIPPRIGSLEVATRGLLRAARRHQVPVHVWTLNRPEQWDRYLALGVDGIMTDDTAGLIRHLERLGKR